MKLAIRFSLGLLLAAVALLVQACASVDLAGEPSTATSREIVPATIEPCNEESANPRIQHLVMPEYTAEAANKGLSGEAIVKVLVLADGSVGEAQILQSTGHAILDDAALVAAKECIFKAGYQRCIPVKAWMALPFEFPPTE